MDDFPIDEDELDTLRLQHSPSLSSTFDGLYTVNPPSPILTPSQLAFTWSSGDIPLVLYDEAYAQDLSISDIANSTFTGGNRRDSLGSTSVSKFGGLLGRKRISAGVPKSATSSCFESSLLGFASLDSSKTISSVGTFGPKRKTQQCRPNEPQTADFDCHPEHSSPSEFAPVAVQEERVSVADEESVFRRRRSRPSTSGIFASPSVLATGRRFSRAMENDDLDARPVSQNFDLEDRRQSLRSSPRKEFESQEISISRIYDRDDGRDDEPVTPTPMGSMIPKTISWISSRDWDGQQYKDYIARKELSRLSPASHTPDIDIETLAPPRRVIATHPGIIENRDINVIVETPRASQFPYELPEHRKERSPHDNHHSHVPNTIQQDNYAWLRDVTVQFLIDQEGFRAARPDFKFTGVARLRSSQSSRAPGTVMAQFRPVARQTFHFHYAPFETPPILRRVTVDFDETHDYLSKQAHLTLKSNGVYVLHGHEMSSVGHETEPVKLHWQFEYLVDDRRVEGTGRIIEGEKILTPLTFSCTPALTLPAQGKRNSIMHVFKKGVGPKLVAEKLQPPGAVRVANKPGGTLTSSETEMHISHFFSSKSHAWNLHKRGRSHGVQHVDVLKANNNRTNLHWPRNRGAEHAGPEQHIRRRRASSAGENRRSSDIPRFSTLMSFGRRQDVSAADQSTVTPPSRHIIPPAKLAKLLDTPTSPTELNLPPTHRDSSALVPLTPRPRHASRIRDPSRTQ